MPNWTEVKELLERWEEALERCPRRPLHHRALLTACHSWQPTTVSPQALLPAEQPSSVRVTLTNGETVTVRDPTMRNDSIVGVTENDRGPRTSPVEVASQDIRLLEVRRLSVTKNIVLAFPVIWVVAFVVLRVSESDECGFGC